MREVPPGPSGRARLHSRLPTGAERRWLPRVVELHAGLPARRWVLLPAAVDVDGRRGAAARRTSCGRSPATARALRSPVSRWWSAMTLVALVLAASIGPVAFKAPGGFVITSRAGEVQYTVRSIDGLAPESLAVSPDGATWVFTSHDETAGQPLLYRASRVERPALIGRPTGFHAQPSFTNDGRWVFFIHHPDRSGGAPGEHGPRAFGQVWRVRLDGSGLAQVTHSEGCKLSPDASSSEQVAMTHADCERSSAIETTSGRQTELRAPLSQFRVVLPRLSPSGDAVAFLRLGHDEFSLVVEVSRRQRVIATISSTERPADLAWASPGAGFFVQFGTQLYRVHPDGTSYLVLDLSETIL